MAAVAPDFVKSQTPVDAERTPLYHGLRMTAEEYFSAADDGFRYELVDGVVIMSPSPTPRHQLVAMEIIRQLLLFLETSKAGRLIHETDLYLGKSESGADLVYRPDLMLLLSTSRSRMGPRIKPPVDVVVEVISRDTRRFDMQTKRNDYERAGVREYWLIDPDRKSMQFLRLVDGKFVESSVQGDVYATPILPGLALILSSVRAEFE